MYTLDKLKVLLVKIHLFGLICINPTVFALFNVDFDLL